jgi:diguanylate cyclase (GGDEF)-like protein
MTLDQLSKHTKAINPDWQKLHPSPNETSPSSMTAVLRASEEKTKKWQAGENALKQLELTTAKEQTDPLTKVKNRSWLEEFTQQLDLEKQHHTLAIIAIDLDGFKEVNDDHGHLTGDEVLKKIAHFLSEHFRSKDEIVQLEEVVRLGGDEFLIICYNQRNDRNFLEHLKQKMLDLQQHPDKPNPFSFGVALFDKDLDQTLESTINRADQHMYRDKNERKPFTTRFLQPLWRAFGIKPRLKSRLN